MVLGFLYLEGHHNCMIGSKVSFRKKLFLKLLLCITGSLKRKVRAMKIKISEVTLQMLIMCECASKLPQNSKFPEFSNLECFYLVIQVGSTDLNDCFGLPRVYWSWGSKVTFALKPFL